ncbi:uncharacterized protein LOC110700196 [Chenopodium quinoa]|uniref:uncharacterized protein LOC110700196 n=1 Tax=Chenopodium quinoa TaxID=63459 RepID=UPI000B781B6F|nr:uncharacterized protein LOC110700196 [Chenopodium quinoa]
MDGKKLAYKNGYPKDYMAETSNNKDGYPIYRRRQTETVQRLGLLEDDDAASICLAEALEVQLPDALRRLFATVLIFCQPSDPSALWEKYYTALSEDFSHKFKGDTDKIKQLTKTRDIADTLDAAIPQEFINTKERLNTAQFQAAREDLAFCSFLLSLGNGELQKSESDYVRLPDGMIQHLLVEEDPILKIINATFPELEKGTITSDIVADREILTPMNDDVDLVNLVLIDRFPGESVTYKSFDVMLNDTCNIYPTKFINKLCPGGMSPHQLVLKKDCPVTLLRNIMPSEGLCNGTRLVCKTFLPNVIVCEISVGQYKGTPVFVHRANLRPPANSSYPFAFERKQFPIKLCFAMTINKSQGQTLNQVSIYLPRPCFFTWSVVCGTISC